MKKITLTIAVLGAAVAAFAQGQPLGFGLKAGVNFPKYQFSGNGGFETSATTNFHVTAFLDAPIFTDYLYVQPGLSLQGKGAKIVQIGDFEVSQHTMWLEVPVNLIAKAPAGNAGHLFVGAGPYVAFGLSGKNKGEFGSNSIDTKVDFGSDGDLKGTDFGLNFTAGFQLFNGLMIHGGYGLGLTDISGTPDEGFPSGKLTNRVWSVGLGFVF